MISQRSFSTRRGVEARLTKPRTLVWSGGFMKSIGRASPVRERRSDPSTAMREVDASSFMGLPQRASRKSARECSKPDTTHVSPMAVLKIGAVSRSCL